MQISMAKAQHQRFILLPATIKPTQNIYLRASRRSKNGSAAKSFLRVKVA